MIGAVAVLVLAAVTSSVVTPVVRRIAVRAGVVDEPGGRRVHKEITPRLGGLAVMAGFFLPLAVFAVVKTGAVRGFLQREELVLGLVLGGVVVGAVGAIDDVRSLGPWSKLFAQTVGAVIAYAFGYRIDAINIPLFGTVEMGILALPVTVFWFLAITNAINLIDGLDGLAAGIALFATVANFGIAYLNGSDVALLLSAALAGSLLGFLRHNFNPATIFLGDSGSMFLGFVLAATSLVGAMTKSSTAVAILAPIIALGVPIVDTLLAMIRRSLARQSIFAADRGHIHHRLLDLGFTHRRVVLTLYGLSVALALAAVAIAFGRSAHVGAALGLLGVVAYFVVRSVRSETKGERQRRGQDVLATHLRAAANTIALLGDESGIRQALGELGGVAKGLEAKLVSGASSSIVSAGTRLFDVSADGRSRVLVIVLTADHWNTPDLEDAVEHLVRACRLGLERVAARASATSAGFRVAPVHVSNGED